MKRVKLERQPEEARDLGRRLGARGIDADAAGHRLDPDLPAGDDPMEAVVVPHRRPVRAEVAEAHGREMEVIRLRTASSTQSARVTSWKSSKRSNGTPRASR